MDGLARCSKILYDRELLEKARENEKLSQKLDWFRRVYIDPEFFFESHESFLSRRDALERSMTKAIDCWVRSLKYARVRSNFGLAISSANDKTFLNDISRAYETFGASFEWSQRFAVRILDLVRVGAVSEPFRENLILPRGWKFFADDFDDAIAGLVELIQNFVKANIGGGVEGPIECLCPCLSCGRAVSTVVEGACEDCVFFVCDEHIDDILV
jgi:hypothetical protein